MPNCDLHTDRPATHHTQLLFEPLGDGPPDIVATALLCHVCADNFRLAPTGAHTRNILVIATDPHRLR